MYTDYEDDETVLAPCKERVWKLGFHDMTKELRKRKSNSAYKKRHSEKCRIYLREYRKKVKQLKEQKPMV